MMEFKKSVRFNLMPRKTKDKVSGKKIMGFQRPKSNR